MTHTAQQGRPGSLPGNSRLQHSAEEMPPEFAPLLNREYMAQVLAAISGEPGRVRYCGIEHVHFKTFLKPGSARKAWLSVSYQVSIDSGDGVGQRIFMAKAHLDGRGRRAYAEQGAGPEQGVHYLPEHDTIVWCFPADPAMPWLPTLMDSDTARALIPWQQLQPSSPEPGAAPAVQAEVVHYRPEQRCLIRYGFENPGTPRPPLIYAKTYAENMAAIVSDRIVRHWCAGCQDPARFLVARPLGFSAELHTVWQQELVVEPLASVLEGEDAPALLDRLAHALALFHTETGGDCAPLRRGEHYEETIKKLHKLRQAYPDYGARLSYLQHLVRADADRSVLAPQRLLHNDLHLRQLGLCGDRIALFDFDEFRHGDPTQDLADLVVDLLHEQGAAGLPHVRQLVSSYQTHCDWPIEAMNLAWHARNKFLAKAYRAHLQRLPSTLQRVAFLLEQARAIGDLDLGLGRLRA